MPAATRIGDLDLVHCSVPTRAQGSPNVFVNGLAWSRQGDFNTPHLLPGTPCTTHAAPISSGSTTVKINGYGAGRIGDSIGTLVNGILVNPCTIVASGSSNVFAGG